MLFSREMKEHFKFADCTKSRADSQKKLDINFYGQWRHGLLFVPVECLTVSKPSFLRGWPNKS
jgi:hypothetical protein